MIQDRNDGNSRGRGRAVVLAGAGLFCGVAASLFCYLAPLSATVSGNPDGDGMVVGSERIFSATLSSLWPVLLPIAIAAMACLAAWFGHRPGLAAMTLLLAVYCFLGGFSIGFFYLPALVLLAAALVVLSRSGRGRPGDAPSRQSGE